MTNKNGFYIEMDMMMLMEALFWLFPGEYSTGKFLIVILFI